MKSRIRTLSLVVIGLGLVLSVIHYSQRSHEFRNKFIIYRNIEDSYQFRISVCKTGIDNSNGILRDSDGHEIGTELKARNKKWWQAQLKDNETKLVTYRNLKENYQRLQLAPWLSAPADAELPEPEPLLPPPDALYVSD